MLKRFMLSKEEYGTLLKSLVWFHDIGRKYEKELQESHAVISARMAEEFLSQYELSKELDRIYY